MNTRSRGSESPTAWTLEGEVRCMHGGQRGTGLESQDTPDRVGSEY